MCDTACEVEVKKEVKNVRKRPIYAFGVEKDV